MRNEAAIGFAGTRVRQSARERTSQLLEPAIFNALLTLIALTAIPYGTVHPWWEAAFECAVFALGALWIIDRLVSGARRVGGHRLFVPLIALIALALLQTIPLWGINAGSAGIKGEMWRALSVDPYETRRFTLKLLAMTLAGALLLHYTSNQRRLRALINVVIGVGAASALFGIVRQMAQGNAPNFILPRLLPDGSYGQFIDRNHFAFLMEMALGLVLGLIGGRGVGRDRRFIYLAAALLLWAALVLSNSRGGIFSLLNQLLFLALLFGTRHPSKESQGRSGNGGGDAPRWWRRISHPFILRSALVVSLLVAVTVSILWAGGDSLMHRLETVPREFSANDDDKRTNARRVEIWRATWRLIKDHPIAGVGFGAYWIALPRYHDASGVFAPEEAQTRPVAAHNECLELLASGGLIGGALGAWFITVFIRRARERLRGSSDPFRRAACLGALVGLFGVAVHSLMDFGLHDTVNAFVFTSLAVIATVNGRVEGKTLRSGGARHPRPASSWAWRPSR